MAEPLLTLKDLSLGYGRCTVVSGLSVEVRPGTVTALVGPNASGKTTVFRGLFADGPWLSGIVRWRGAVVRDLRDKQVPEGAVAWVRQDRPIFAQLTVEEAIRAALLGEEFSGFSAPLSDLLGKSRAAQRRCLDAVLGWLPELETRDASQEKGLLDKLMSYLSGGERLIAALGVALANQPLLLCLDEPAAGLDVTKNLPRVQQVLRRYVIERGAGCLVIEHREEFIRGFADAVIPISSPDV